MEFRPIGTVSNGIIEDRGRDWTQVVSEVRLSEQLSPALDGLEEFSHIIVLFHCHWAEPAVSMKTHPQRRDELPLVGRFATRSPSRPNPIALTVVRLLERRGNVLRVQGLDALDGTPVLDIKPYIPYGDSVPDAAVPEWIHTLNRERGE